MNSQAFADWSAQVLARVESALDEWVPLEAPAGLGQAMRYGVLDGGKRLRALLVMAAAQAAGATQTSAGRDAALRAACAVELIHAYSLVHDDMPCMDNDVLRRGKPTVHVQFGEAQAMLAGDALQALAFEVLTPDVCPEELRVCAPIQARLCRLLARSAGQAGMAGGQALDLGSGGHAPGGAPPAGHHHPKDRPLAPARRQEGGGAGGIDESGPAWHAFTDYGDAMGLAFQIVDDILDATQASSTLGKTAGKDADANKPTYVTLLGLDPARQEVDRLLAQAQDALSRSGLPTERTQALIALAERIVHRDH